MKNRIQILKVAYKKMLVQKKRDEERQTENVKETLEDLCVTIGTIQHLGVGNRRMMPFILL